MKVNNRKIVPDVVASAAQRGFTLLVEVKSGGQIDHDQLSRMKSVSAVDLRDLHHLPIPEPAAHAVLVIYFCNESHLSEIAAQVGDRASVVGFDGRRFHIAGAPLADVELHRAIQEAEVAASSFALAIIPFDQESELGDVARVIVPVLIAQLIHGTGVVTSEGVLQKTHATVLGVMQSTGAGSELRPIRERVTDVLREASGNELKEWIERLPVRPEWRFRRALSSDPANRTRELQSLQKLGYALVERLGGGSGIQLEIDDIVVDS